MLGGCGPRTFEIWINYPGGDDGRPSFLKDYQNSCSVSSEYKMTKWPKTDET